MLRIVFGILIGSALTAAAEGLTANAPEGGLPVQLDAAGHIICIPPWPTTDSLGVVHAGGVPR